MRPDPRIPAGLFAQYGFDAARFVRSDRKSVRGPCPVCGGQRRMVVFIDRPNPNFECICGYKGFMDSHSRPDADTLAELKAKAAAEADERERRIERARREFTASELWEAYHRRLSDEQYAWWAGQGIARDWADFYHMGYVADKVFGSPSGPFHSAAYTIPIYDVDWKPVNMQYRIDQPPEGVGKYRQEMGLPAAAFLSRPDQPIPDSMIVVEGAKKAAVLCARLPRQPQIAGLPGAMSWAGMDERLAECGRVWVLLDPDAQAAAVRLAQSIGKNARIVTLPAKPDDAFLKYGATVETFRRAFRCAERVN